MEEQEGALHLDQHVINVGRCVIDEHLCGHRSLVTLAGGTIGVVATRVFVLKEVCLLGTHSNCVNNKTSNTKLSVIKSLEDEKIDSFLVYRLLFVTPLVLGANGKFTLP